MSRKFDKMKKIAVAIIVAIAAISVAYLIENELHEGKENVTASLIINFGNYTKNYTITLNERNATVYGILIKASHEYNFSVVATYYSQYNSYFIESIDGFKNGNGKYWQYWINGEYGKVGANLQKIKNGDVIEWKLI